MKGKSNFGYKFLFFITLVVALLHLAASGRGAFDTYDPEPADTTSASKKADSTKTAKKNDSARKLKFPIYDNTGDPMNDRRPGSIDFNDPSNIKKTVDYDPDEKKYYFSEKIGDQYYRNPTYLTMDEYLKYQAKEDEQNYWKRRMDALTLFNKKPQLPQMYREGMFDRIFGGTGISVRPQGNVDVTFGGNWQNIKNPTLVQRAQKYGVFDFDMQMNVNLLATVGDKMKLNISNNTKATFDYQNQQKLEYSGKEDEILKKIEAGNISFPLKSSLVSGVQSLFGIKAQLQFGKLWVTTAISQQKSKRSSLTVQGGSQTQQFNIKADDYEENKHFLLAQYFYGRYDLALKEFPVINSQVTINRMEVWVTNRTGAVDGVRDVLAFMDLGEKEPYEKFLEDPSQPEVPNNRANRLYADLLQFPNGRKTSGATNAAVAIGLHQGTDFERVTARKLNTTEYSFNPQLGYISMNSQLNSDDILAVAYRFTYKGKVYQVGEFAEDLPPDSTNPKVIYLKLLKGTASRPRLPIWNLMMKNVYALGSIGVTKEDFRFNVFYQDPGGGEKRYLPEGPKAGVPILTLLNLDKLNIQNDPSPDGVFDYVEGITINPQQGKIIFPVLHPFGDGLSEAVGTSQQLQRKYLYKVLYDSTKTIARQFQQNNRYVMRGSYKSASSAEIFLGGFNIPAGSVTVSAGGQKLTENVDYQVDYGLGRLKILNQGILSSGIPINISYEDNATFGFQQQNFIGTRLDYYVNNKLTLGGTYMRLSERPFTQKASFGEDPIKNTVMAADVNYQSEFPALTRALDRLPIYSTTTASFINVTGEVATIKPSHPTQINALDPEGSVYIDDFEGTKSAYDMKFPSQAWSLASTPVGAKDKTGKILFPEAELTDDLRYGYNRARLAWYNIEPTLVDPVGGVPSYVKNEPNQHYIRQVQQQDVFPTGNYATFQNAVSTFDLGFYPKERGPYNFDATNLDANGKLLNPEKRWGGIMRPIDYSDFEQSNVQFIEFWLLDPFINNNSSAGGSLFFNLGNVSEDILKDSRKSYENGTPYPKVTTQLDTSVWGYTPRFGQQITRAFDNDPAARKVQDVGYDALDDDEEQVFFKKYLNQLAARYGTGSAIYQQALADPANDNFHYYRGSDYDNANYGVLTRYKMYNNPQGNSPVTDPNSAYSTAATTIPESEDLNRDNTMNESENYYQYRVDLKPNMPVGSNYIINKQVSNVKLPNGNVEAETWYQFKVPIQNYDSKVGDLSDYRSIRFLRMFLSGFEDSVVMRFSKLELGRNQWRQYLFSLQNPGENIPITDKNSTDFSVQSVSVEENSQRQPIPYVIPPGVNRQQAAVSNGQNIQLNEQALSVKVCGLKDGDSRAVFKEVNVDMRQFSNLRMFIHAEAQVGQTVLKDGDLRAFIRIGSDYTNNYYEYQIPLKVTQSGANTGELIWPEENRLNLLLSELVTLKTERDNKGMPVYVPYVKTLTNGNIITIVGSPSLGEAKGLMLGILNPKKSTTTPGDDGQPKCVEVWFNELRMAGLNEQSGYAASGKVNVQLADLGTVRLSGSMHTQGYGNIDQKIQQRFRDDFYQYNASTNLNLGKLMPRKWGVQLPAFFGYSQNVSTPQYDPYKLDVKLSDELARARDAAQRDSIRKAAQDFTSITSFNFTNVRIAGNPDKQATKTMPWSIKNFDFTYAFSTQFKHNSLISEDRLTTQKFGLGYTYAIRSKSFEPFKKAIKSKNKWYGLIKDFNVKPLPSSVSFRNDMNRVVDQTQVRNISDGPYQIPATFYKNFTWTRQYNMRWELTKSLSFDYAATNISRIDEPYGLINTTQKKDSLLDRIKKGGRNTNYNQSFNSSYNLPMQKMPLLDWTNIRLNYSATYTWTAGSLIEPGIGNTIANTQNRGLTGELNWSQLYSKNRFLKYVNLPPPKKDNKQLNNKGAKDSKDGKDGKDGARDNKEPAAKEEKKEEERKKKSKEFKSPTSRQDSIISAMIASGKLSNQQLDSLVKVQDALAEARRKAEKEKKRLDKIAKRKKRKSKPPEINTIERIVGRLFTMVKRTNVNYSELSGTVLPGYTDSTNYLGVNKNTLSPGLDFVYGYQPDKYWLEAQAANGRISRDSLFNGQLQQRYSQTLNLTTTVEPLPDLRVDLSLNRTFSKTHSEIFKDTNYTGPASYAHLNPYETGSFSESYIGINTIFKSSGANSAVFKQFQANRIILSQRLGTSNPYTNGVKDPNNPNYTKGYTQYSQDVLIPAFIAAYTGQSASSVAQVDYTNSSIKSNPFKYYLPLPNWRVSYTGLSKLPWFSDVFTNFTVNHSYSGTMSMGSFTSSLFYQDLYNLGYPSFLDSSSGNYVPFFQIPTVTIAEQFSPLIGFDMAFKNNVTARIEYRKSRTVSLSLVDYQIAQTNSSEIVIGFGYRAKNIRLPFEIFGVKKLKNDLTVKVDVGVRDDITTNNYLAQNLDVTSRGQKVITIAPSVDYIINKNLTLRFFFDRRQTIPYVSSSFPITTTRGGLTLRFIFAQ